MAEPRDSGESPPFADGDKGKGGVLIVDDKMEVTELFSEVLRFEGYRVASVNDSAGALEVELPFRPDVILVDAKMPGMDGFELIRRLRNRFREGVRLVMLTGPAGPAGPDHERRAVSAGADEFISKPVPMETLLSCVQRQLQALRAGNAKHSSEC